MAISTGTNQLDVGYIEFPLNGKDYSGSYTTKTGSTTFRYDIEMKATKNLVGQEQYSIWTQWSDNKGHSGQWETFRCQGETLHISNGHFKVRSCYLDKTDPI